MADRILVEFYSTCPDCRGAESLVSHVCHDLAWEARTVLVAHRRDEDPCAGDPDLRVAGPTVVVDRTSVIKTIGIYVLRRALEDAWARRSEG